MLPTWAIPGPRKNGRLLRVRSDAVGAADHRVVSGLRLLPFASEPACRSSRPRYPLPVSAHDDVVLVIGGSSGTGRASVELLHRRNVRSRVLTRDPPRAVRRLPPGV